MVDYVRTWADKTELHANALVGWIGIPRSQYYQWKDRYGQVNEHNAWVPRDHWLEDWEKRAIVTYQQDHPLEGYRRLTYMMMDADIVAVSPASTYRVLKAGGLLGKWNVRPSSKGTGFQQPVGPHEHWHIDVSYLNICGTFYYLCSILDGFSRYIVQRFVTEYNTVRLHSAIQYITPADKLAGRAEAILAGRDAKLAAAREARRIKRQQERISA